MRSQQHDEVQTRCNGGIWWAADEARVEGAGRSDPLQLHPLAQAVTTFASPDEYIHVQSAASCW